jgi:hypothetical protein
MNGDNVFWLDIDFAAGIINTGAFIGDQLEESDNG